VLVFCNTVPSARSTAHFLGEQGGLTVASLHGGIPPRLRQSEYELFLRGGASVLVCTDAAARGLDFPGARSVSVVLFDFPLNAVEYLHRAGRAARAGRDGAVVSLVARRDLVLATPTASPSTLPQPDRRGGLAGDLFWGVALALPILTAAGLFATLVMNGTGLSAPVVLPPAISSVDLAANVLTAGLIAPIGEELLYRGVIAQAWARQSSARRAILFSAIVFAFAHTLTVGGTSVVDAVSVAAVAFIVRLPLGIALGWLWIRRRSIVATIALHAAYNLAIVAIVALS
jgi:membrane protease YdiL (CAAX protease family)